MISSISGIVKSISLNSVVVEVGGVGILIQVPNRVAISLSAGATASFHTYLVVREDVARLCGPGWDGPGGLNGGSPSGLPGYHSAGIGCCILRLPSRSMY